MANRLGFAAALILGTACAACGETSDSKAAGGSGGSGGNGGDPCPTGEIGQWRSLPASGVPAPESTTLSMWRVDGVWSGSHFLLFADVEGVSGAAYDPCSEEWRPTPPGHPNAYGSGAFRGFVGSRYVVWKPTYSADPAIGAWLDSELTAWTPMSSLDAPGPDEARNVFFTDQGIVAFGAITSGLEPIVNYAAGTRYDLSADSWTKASAPGGFAPRSHAAQALASGKLLVWGGIPDDSGFAEALGDGALYDPESDTWTATNSDGAPSARAGAVVVSTGTHVIVWRGYGTFQDLFQQHAPKLDGGIYDPSKNAWSPISADGAPELQSVYHAAWTGKQLFVLGVSMKPGLAGGLYDPASGIWTAISTAGGPTFEEAAGARGPFVTAQGSILLAEVYSPMSPPTPGPTVRSFDTSTNTWMTPSMTGQPEHPALVLGWTGSRLISWGGYESEPTGCNGQPGCDPYPKYTYWTDGMMFRAE